MRITALTQWCGQLGRAVKSSEEAINEKITQNATLATVSNSRLEQGLAQLEAQVLACYEATYNQPKDKLIHIYKQMLKTLMEQP